MAIGQIVATQDGYGEILEESRGRFGSTSYRVLGEFGEGWYSAREILSEIDHNDDDGTTTDINFHDSDVNDQNGEASSTLAPDENTWLDGGTKLPWNPHPTEEWDGHLTQEFEDHNISLKPTKSTDGADLHPDEEDHNAIFEKKHSAKFAYDSEDEDWEETNDYKDREEGKEKESSVGPRQAFVEYLDLIEKNQFVREAAWSDVRRKANRLYKNGAVMVEHNDGREIRAKVDGDHGRYEVKVARKNAFGKGITWYDCDCEWGKWAYKRARTFVGRLCSHGLATYFAMQANRQPEKPTKRINDKTERHNLAARSWEDVDAERNSGGYGDGRPSASDLGEETQLNAINKKYVRKPSETSLADDPWVNAYNKKSVFVPKSTPVETESLAARQGGLMIWDDDLQKVVKNFFPAPPSPADISADPAAGAPAAPASDPAGTVGPDLSTELAQDQPAAPTFDGADSNFMPDTSPGTPITDKVRTAEYSKNPNTDDLFESFDDVPDEEKFNDAGDKKTYDEKNDPEFAMYDEFWGRSSSIVEAGPYEDAFQKGLNPDKLPANVNPLPHFIRRKTAADRTETEGHTEQELKDMAERFNLNGQPEQAAKFIDNRRRLQNHEGAKDSEGDFDYHENAQSDDHETDYEKDPNDNVNGNTNDNGQKGRYQSDHWLDEDEAQWQDHEKDEDDGPFDKSSAYTNIHEAEEFNNDADGIVAQFQRSAGAQALFSDSDDSGAFLTVATDPNAASKRVQSANARFAGRHFNYAEQQELIDEPGVARHVADLDLDGTFYLD